jgi:hypothetical protein
VDWAADWAMTPNSVWCSKQALTQDAFERAWAEGAALSVTGAVAYASRARGERSRPSSGWTSLTPTETAVVDLVAKGLTNQRSSASRWGPHGTITPSEWAGPAHFGVAPSLA